MRFALVNGARHEAERGLPGECRGCGQAMLPRCGEKRVHHWAHRGRRHCDHWWEPETEWHRAWKDRFPADWQEIRHEAPDGEIHIADMKTPLGQVLEFQYSYIKPAEVRSREAFYEALVWVVNGWRRDGDRAALPSRWEETKPVTENGSVRRIRTKGERLIRDWGQSQVEVFFGFQESNKADDGSDRMLWWLHRPPGAKWSHVAPYPLPEFVARYGSASASAEIGPDPLIDSFEREAKADIAELEGLYDWRGPSDTPDAPRRPLGDLQDPAEREAVRASREKNLKRAIRMVKESQRRADGAG